MEKEPTNSNPLETAIGAIQKEYLDEDVTFEFRELGSGEGEIRISYQDRSVLEGVLRKISDLLKERGCELGQFHGGGNSSERYMVYQREVEGKINWRRWIPYPEKFSPDTRELLDKLAEFTDLHERVDAVDSDGLEKFDTFVRIGLKEGLITAKEAERVDEEKHLVV